MITTLVDEFLPPLNLDALIDAISPLADSEFGAAIGVLAAVVEFPVPVLTNTDDARLLPASMSLWGLERDEPKFNITFFRHHYKYFKLSKINI